MRPVQGTNPKGATIRLQYTLRLLEDALHPNARLAAPLPAGPRAMYVVDGSTQVTSEDRTTEIAENAAWFGTGACSATAGPHGARLWRWELVRGDATGDPRALGDGVASELKLLQDIELDRNESHMMRCDRVDFPLGGIAYTHTHRGPGIRCLLRGELKVTVRNAEETFGPGEPWFERGPDQVYAVASPTAPTSFVRGMVLSRELKGKPSIRYVLPEDQDKPKTQQYTRFVDEFIDI